MLNRLYKNIKKYILLFNLVILLSFRQDIKLLKEKKIINYSDYENKEFAIIKRIECRHCGLFSFYKVYLGCINSFIRKGFIPIIDLQSYENVFNGFNINRSNTNPWEYFFNQPFGYTLNNVKRKAKKIKYFNCKSSNFMPGGNIFYNKTLLNFWHKTAINYIPIKENVLLEVKMIIKKFFKNSHNILGILIRGTDFISKKPKGHAIPPTSSMVIKDIKKINMENNYDWFFISTEDDLIREKFIKEFGYKLKYLIYKKINYNYGKKQYLGYDENIKGNIKFIKIYLINMIILSKCIDIITAITSGAVGVFIFSNGFRYSKVYNLGSYK